MFMELQIVRGDWLEVEFGSEDGRGFVEKQDYEKKLHGKVLGKYYGWHGIRLSAPGYLDCTDWVLEKTRVDAERTARLEFCDCDDESDPGDCPVCSELGIEDYDGSGPNDGERPYWANPRFGEE